MEAFQAANILRNLDSSDLRILVGIELSMKFYEDVPLKEIIPYTKLPKDEVQYRLDQMYDLGILLSHKGKQERTYRLINLSYDILALHTFAQQDLLQEVGGLLGDGKESQVFLAKTPAQEQVAIKFHRVGQTSFRNVRKLRNYIDGKKHISWLYVNRLSAESEYEGLNRVKDLDVNISQPLGQNRNAVVMKLIEGDQLNKFRKLSNPTEVYNMIIHHIRVFFEEGHLIHGDMSEFNVILTPEEEVFVIDFPQWVPWNHVNWKYYLERDLRNITTYFERKFNVSMDINEFIESLEKPTDLIDD